jgi:hypothetical protein
MRNTFTGMVVWLKEQGAWGYRTRGSEYAFNQVHEIEHDFLPYIKILGDKFRNPKMSSDSYLKQNESKIFEV